MSYGTVYCSECQHEVSQEREVIDGVFTGKRFWIHFPDLTPICEGARVLYEDQLNNTEFKKREI